MPQLPFEILDGILEEGLKVLPLSSLSSLALTSRGFRIYANEARFSTLLPYKGHVGHDCDGTIRRLDSLADVIRTGHSIPTLPGVGDFVTSFQLKVTGYATALQRVLDSQSIPFIFANIFRPSPLYTSVNKPRSLMLSLHPFEWGYSSDVRIHWSMLHDGFRGEFANLLCLSDLDELHLRQIKGVPSSFLQGSKVKHLNFRGVSLQSSVSGKSAPINLQSLSIDHFISFQDLVQLCFNSSFSPPPQSFRSLTNASLQVNHAEDMDTLNDILGNAPHIQHLGILLHYMGPSE
ncbi:hypothetical protein JR316_0008540 [Psilocybe cubensis]|uniref:F-box domain-containing protein n=2 Tax=Psilocybe cubensis TaxID=181762 RepID=A0A8H7XJF6_PSICU|nr:hypothetical protein JR316_0008540 [Psilocybe cubensis]KAH9479943.1 hypothetical protein JR316_0008540 [Psilocybe cubensis]